MKIVIAAGIYPPDSGGPATYSQLIAREFNDQGIEVSLICYSDNGSQFAGPRTSNIEPINIIRISRKYNIFARYFLYFYNLLKLAKKADIIYAQGPLAAGLPAMLISKILRKKFIIKIVGDYAWEQYQNEMSKPKCQMSKIDLIDEFQKKTYDWKTELRRKIQKKVVSSANKVIVPSEYLKKIVLGWGIDGSKIKVIYNAGPNITETNGGRPTSNIHDNIGTSDVLISAGRLEPWKGMDTLVEIMPDLLKENFNFKLIIIGRGPLEEAIRLRTSNFELKNSVQLIDRVPHDELMNYFKASKIFVLNTGYEGLSHLLLEAMTCGLPIITTNVCGNPEVIENEFNGLLVEYNNKEQLKSAILRLWKDENLRNKFIENGKKTLEKFGLERMINETKKVLFESTN